MRHEESKIQIQCKRWFDIQFKKYRKLLFAVPNGGGRSKIEAKIMKGEGVEVGVSDMILLLPSPHGYHSLCIEFKTPKGRQSENQKVFQEQVEQHGNKYIIVRSVEDFIKEIKNYLN